MTSDQLDDIIRRALDEDLPDITTDSIFTEGERATARFLAKASGILAGLPAAARVFSLLDASAHMAFDQQDGEHVEAGGMIATVSGPIRTLLTGERTALNLLQRASGIATMTRRYVDAVAGTGVTILDTRKTAPGLRPLDRYAVRMGGGRNHRSGLFDMFLLKNNHIDGAGSIREAMQRVRRQGTGQPVMIEVRNLEELEEASAAGPDFILLDNMDLETLREAVALIGGRIPLEASGGVTLETVRAIAETGVDRISVGALTHSVEALDISLRIEAR